MLSRANGATYTLVSRAGDVQTFSGHFVPARTVAIGDGKSEGGIAGTVAIGDRNSGGVYSWDSAERLGQARVLWFYRRRMLWI